MGETGNRQDSRRTHAGDAISTAHQPDTYVGTEQVQLEVVVVVGGYGVRRYRTVSKTRSWKKEGMTL